MYAAGQAIGLAAAADEGAGVAGRSDCQTVWASSANGSTGRSQLVSMVLCMFVVWTSFIHRRGQTSPTNFIYQRCEQNGNLAQVSRYISDSQMET